MPRLSDRAWLALILLIACLLYLGSVGFFDLITTSYGSDVGRYLILAQSLAEGKGYRYINEPAQPQATRYPVAVPALLSPVVAAFPRNMVAARLLAVVWALLSVLACYAFLRQQAPHWAVTITALFAMSVFTVSTATLPQSDLLFCLFSMLALAMSRVYRRSAGTVNAALPVLVVLTLTVMHTRLVGIVLAFALVLDLWLQRQPSKATAVAVLLATGFAPWLAYTYAVDGSLFEAVYWRDFLHSTSVEAGPANLAAMARSWLSNAVWYFTTTVPDGIAGIFMGRVVDLAERLHVAPLLYAAGAAISAVVALGFWRRLRTRVSVVELYVLLYGMVLIADSARSVRYVIPIAPVLYLYLFTGLQRIGRRSEPWLPRVVAAAILVIMLVRVASYYDKGISSSLERSGRQDWLVWLADQTEANALIYCGSPKTISFLTGRSALDYPGDACNAGATADVLRSKGPVYVALHPTHDAYGQSYRCLNKLVQQNSSRFDQVFRDDRLRVVIYRTVQN